MFKAGERVWHSRLGWGVLQENYFACKDEYPLMFVNDIGKWTLTYCGRQNVTDLYPSIYYKEQAFDMSKPEPEIGTWGYFWDEGKSNTAAFSKLSKILDSEYKYVVEAGVAWKNFSPDIPPHIKELMNGTNTDNP